MYLHYQKQTGLERAVNAPGEAQVQAQWGGERLIVRVRCAQERNKDFAMKARQSHRVTFIGDYLTRTRDLKRGLG